MRHDWREISRFHHLRSREVPAPVDLSLGGGRKSEILGFDRDILLVATAKQTILGNPRRACVFLLFCNYIFQNENILNLGSTSPSPGRFKEKRLQGKAGEMPRKPFPTRQLKKYAALNQDQTRREGSFFLGHPLKGQYPGHGHIVWPRTQLRSSNRS